jgi:hypothetical protein
MLYLDVLQEYINEILPKKVALKVVKCQDHIELISTDSETLFFKKRDGPFYPTLRLLHMYPNMLPKVCTVHCCASQGMLSALLCFPRYAQCTVVLPKVCTVHCCASQGMHSALLCFPSYVQCTVVLPKVCTVHCCASQGMHSALLCFPGYAQCTVVLPLYNHCCASTIQFHRKCFL